MGTPAQFIEQSLLSGYNEGEQQRQQKKDEEHALKINDLVQQRTNLISKIPTFAQGTPEYMQAHDALQSVNADIADAYHPQKHPGAIATLGHVLTDHLGLTKPQPTTTMVNPRARGLVESGNINIWNRPTVDNGDGTHSSEYSTSFEDENGHEVLVPTVVNGKFLTPDGKKPPEGSDAERSMFHAAWEHYKKTGEHLGKFNNPKDADIYAQVLHNRGNYVPKNIQQQLAKDNAIAKLTDQQIAAAPLTPQQQTLANIRGAMENFKTLNPSSTSEEQQAYLSELLRGASGIKPNSENYKIITINTPDGKTISAQQDTKSGKIFDLNGQPFSKEILSGATATGDQSADTRRRADFDAWKKKYKERTGKDYEGSLEQWTVEQRNAGKGLKFDTSTGQVLDQATGKRYNRWDKDAPPEVADIFTSQKASTEEKQHNAMALAYARGQAYNQSRLVQVISPNDPEKVVYMPAGEAAKSEAGTPASIGYSTDKTITRYMTSGQGGTNINYFNTATDHLRLLKEAGDALNNGNIQAFNRYANQWSSATGNPAPSNFETVKAAVAGELSKTFKGTGATDQEIGQINQTINSSQSPQQIQGAIDYYTRLMGSKVNALKSQYEAAKQGRPNFEGESSSSGDKYIYAKDTQGKVHRAKMGTPLPKGWVITSAPK